MALALGVFTAAFLIVVLLLNQFAVPVIAEAIAESTSEWIQIPRDQYENISTDIEKYIDPSWQVSVSPDGEYYMRDLSTYHALRNLKIPLALLFYLGSCIFIIYRGLSKSLAYFDDLSVAVARLIENKEASVDLPDELFITRTELTEIKERSLRNERAAQAAEQRKNELVAYLAHDIKTPLTSVLGYLSLLHESPDLPVESRAKYAGIALDKAERLESLIDEFFEITRYNLQSIPIERENLDVELFCEQIAEEFFPEAEERNITFEVKASHGKTFFVDPDKLARALANVARNAVAYADAGSTIYIEATQSLQETTISVANQGKEISEVHLRSIFEKFYREDSSRTTEKGGAGLGLAIAREIIQAHKGSIVAQSEQGRTAFIITIPRSETFDDKGMEPPKAC